MAAAQSSGQTAGGLDLGPGNQEQESAGPGWADGNSSTLGSRVSGQLGASTSLGNTLSSRPRSLSGAGAYRRLTGGRLVVGMPR